MTSKSFGSRVRLLASGAFFVCAGAAVLLMGTSSIVHAQDADTKTQAAKRPSLIITSDPVPQSLKDTLYQKPVQVREITPAEVVGRDYYQGGASTIVTQTVQKLKSHLGGLQSKTQTLSRRLNALQGSNEARAAEYFASVATVNTQLQSGTTPGNPRLVRKLQVAESKFEAMSQGILELNQIAAEASKLASEGAFLLDEARAAYAISGAVEEDHVMLAQTEDSINATLVAVDRVLNTVNDAITRTNVYLNTERQNLRMLSVAVANGDLFGKSLGNRPFSNVNQFSGGEASYNEGERTFDRVVSQPAYASPSEPVYAEPAVMQSGPRPLAKIKFANNNVDYEQPVYMAVERALEQYPNARFEIVAVHPAKGNAAEVAIQSTKARRNAEDVLRVLTQMGLPLERIDLSYDQSEQASVNEVHLYMR